jgi:hypothetical protein
MANLDFFLILYLLVIYPVIYLNMSRNQKSNCLSIWNQVARNHQFLPKNQSARKPSDCTHEFSNEDNDIELGTMNN